MEVMKVDIARGTKTMVAVGRCWSRQERKLLRRQPRSEPPKEEVQVPRLAETQIACMRWKGTAIARKVGQRHKAGAGEVCHFPWQWGKEGEGETALAAVAVRRQ